MSYSEILNITPGIGAETIIELKNSHGSAPVVWSKLCTAAFGCSEFGYWDGEYLEKLWKMWNNHNIPKFERAMIMMTFDRTYVSKKHFTRARRDILQFIEKYPVDADRVNHWPKIAEIYGSDPDYIAIGIYHTSVGENPFQGDWDEEEEKYNTIDWGMAYDLYDKLDEDNKIIHLHGENK